MRKNIFFVISLTCCICSLAGCSKENPVVEKKYANMALNAYTVDNYRFRVSLGDQVLTDSLLAPQSNIRKVIFFDQYDQRLRVYNTSDETLLIDIPYTIGLARLNVFTIYQSQTGTPPVYLAPSSSEPQPAPGKAKLSIMCSGELLSDSIKAVVQVGSNTVETVRLKKEDFSRYFEVTKNSGFIIKCYSIPGNDLLGDRDFSGSPISSDFAIYRLTYSGSTSFGAQQLY